MTLLRQNMLFLVPLFIVLGIMYALVSYELQTKELKWAVDQESRALGHTIQSFAEYNEARYFTAQSDTQLGLSEEFLVILNRIMSQDRMVEIDVLTASGDTLTSLKAEDYSFNIPDFSEAELLYESNFEGTTYDLVRYADHAIISIVTLLETSKGVITLYMVKDAEPYNIRIKELRQWIVYEIAISVVLGIIMSLILTYFIKVRINYLTKESRYFLQGDNKATLDQGAISEFNDLGSTLNILVNVFHKNMDWYRRSIQHKEQDRTSEQLARFIKEKHVAPIEVNVRGYSIKAALTGVDRHSLFVSSTLSEDSLIFWGSVSEKNPIEAALLTEAISDFITNFSEGEANLIKMLQNTFGNTIMELNRLDITDSNKLLISKNTNGSNHEDVIDTSKQTVTWIHSLDSSITEKIDAYSRHSDSLDARQLFSDIRTIVGHIGSTVIIGVRREN